MSIPFTQHLLPDDRHRPVTIDMPADIEEEAQVLIEQGFRFDIEKLSTGMVYLTCHIPGDDDSWTNQLSEDGPTVIDAVTNLVNTAHARLSPKTEKKQQQEER